MTIEDAITTYLLTQTAITAYVGSDVYFAAVCPAAEFLQTDYIRYQLIAASNEPIAFGLTDTAQPEIQFDIFSKNETSCLEIGTLLASALNRFQGTLAAGLTVYYSTASGPMIMPDASDDDWWHGIVYWTPEYER